MKHVATARAVICGHCHALFSTAESAPYVGYDHMLDAHLDLLVAGRAGDVVLSDVTGTARTLLDSAEVSEGAAA